MMKINFTMYVPVNICLCRISLQNRRIRGASAIQERARKTWEWAQSARLASRTMLVYRAGPANLPVLQATVESK